MYLLKASREQILTVPMYSDGPEAPTSNPKLWANIPPKTSIPRLSQAELGTRIQNLIQIDNRVWVTNFTTPHSQSCPWSPRARWVEEGGGEYGQGSKWWQFLNASEVKLILWKLLFYKFVCRHCNSFRERLKNQFLLKPGPRHMIHKTSKKNSVFYFHLNTYIVLLSECIIKVQIFGEGQKNWNHLPLAL